MDRLRNFGFVLKDVSRLYTLNFERYSKALGLSLIECKVLAHLQRNEGISQVQLAELSDVEPMKLVRVLDRMEADGWVERCAHPTDRRARSLALKQAAQPILKKMWLLGDRARSAALEGLTSAEAEQILTLLEKIHLNLKRLTIDPVASIDLPIAKVPAVRDGLGQRRPRVLTAAASMAASAGKKRAGK